jgi:hypothetical protein
VATCEIRQYKRHTYAYRPWPTSSACGPFTRRNVAGFDSGMSSMTPSSLLAEYRGTRGENTRAAPRGGQWGMGSCAPRVCGSNCDWGSVCHPHPAAPEVRSSQMLAQGPGHAVSTYLTTLSRYLPVHPSSVVKESKSWTECSQPLRNFTKY